MVYQEKEEYCIRCKFHIVFFDEMGFDGCTCTHKKANLHGMLCGNLTWGFKITDAVCEYFKLEGDE